MEQQIAFYFRLSIEDRETGRLLEESNSISSQRMLLYEYVSHDKELSRYRVMEFSDDGFSGTSMQRPGMQELLQQVRQGSIVCILVKDLSRFSRDYIELGTYLNQVFPFMGVRFIAVNDHYDSREHDGSTIGMETAFKTLLYDLYSKDISVKVKSSIRNKCANGEYVFGQVPFGYEKSRIEKNVVVVNEKEAEIVRRIFSMAEKRMTSTQIAKKFHDEKLPTASQMRRHGAATEKEHLTWSSNMVRNILNNRFYLGEMAYGKSVCKSVGSKVGGKVPKSEWKVIQGHHEPLVTPEVFARISSFRSEQSTMRKREKHPLTGKIYCGGCGYAINYKPKRDRAMPSHFWCGKHALLQIPDCCTYFNAAILEEIVLAELYRELMRRGDQIKQRESLEKFQREELQRIRKERTVCQEQYQRLQREKASLYEEYAEKRITASDYRRRADETALQIQELLCKIEEMETEYSRMEEEYHHQKQDMKQIIHYSQMETLTQEMVDVFIKRVIVYRDKRVEIEWSYAE